MYVQKKGCEWKRPPSMLVQPVYVIYIMLLYYFILYYLYITGIIHMWLHNVNSHMQYNPKIKQDVSSLSLYTLHTLKRQYLLTNVHSIQHSWMSVCVCMNVHSFLEFVKRAKWVLSITAWGERQLHILLAFRLQQFILKKKSLLAFWPLTGFAVVIIKMIALFLLSWKWFYWYHFHVFCLVLEILATNFAFFAMFVFGGGFRHLLLFIVSILLCT